MAMMTVIVQITSDTPPSMSAGVCAAPARPQEQLIDRVERRCADIAVYDAERPEGQSSETSAWRAGGMLDAARRDGGSGFTAAFCQALHEAGN